MLAVVQNTLYASSGDKECSCPSDLNYGWPRSEISEDAPHWITLAEPRTMRGKKNVTGQQDMSQRRHKGEVRAPRGLGYWGWRVLRQRTGRDQANLKETLDISQFKRSLLSWVISMSKLQRGALRERNYNAFLWEDLQTYHNCSPSEEFTNLYFLLSTLLMLMWHFMIITIIFLETELKASDIPFRYCVFVKL